MLNQCNFIGRLGIDPEVKTTQSGTSVCSFNVACSESWKDKSGEKMEKTEWVRCVAWGKLADICGEYLRKGALVYVSGKMQTRDYEDKDGVKRYVTEINLSEMKMLGAKGDSGERSGQQSSQPDKPAKQSPQKSEKPPTTSTGENVHGTATGLPERPMMGDDVPF